MFSELSQFSPRRSRPTNRFHDAAARFLDSIRVTANDLADKREVSIERLELDNTTDDERWFFSQGQRLEANHLGRLGLHSDPSERDA